MFSEVDSVQKEDPERPSISAKIDGGVERERRRSWNKIVCENRENVLLSPKSITVGNKRCNEKDVNSLEPMEIDGLSIVVKKYTSSDHYGHSPTIYQDVAGPTDRALGAH